MLLPAFLTLLLSLALFYAGVMVRYAFGFRRVLRTPRDLPAQAVLHEEPSALPLVSVLVPARNEEASIEACLTSLLANDYPAERFEVLVIDDASTDRTPELVRRLRARRTPVSASGEEEDRPEDPQIRLLSTRAAPPQAQAHKKRALEQGVRHARGDLILTTDADCLVPQGWIRTMAACFTPRTAFVSGPVLYRSGPDLFGRLQALEFLGLVAVGAGAIGAGGPNLCNGANVAYRRSVFREVGGYRGLDHLTSGDDELLMQKIAYTTPWEIRFCPDPAAVVRTDPAPSLQAFFEQRRRWASKGAHYPRVGLVAMLVLIYLFYGLLLGALLAAPFRPELWSGIALALGLKMGAEAALLYPACRHFGQRRLFRLFVPEQLVQIPYVVFIGAAGALGGYRWKGRRVQR